MKNLTSLLILIAILASLLSLSSCENKSYDRLNETNYTAYINVNFYFSDVKTEYNDGSYTLYCIVHVETSSCSTDYTFSGASLTLSPNVGLFERASNVTLELDGNGVSHSSFTYFNVKSSSPLLPEKWDFEVVEIGGSVITIN